MKRFRIVLLALLAMLLTYCDPEVASVTTAPTVSSAPTDEFASSFRARNGEIRNDIIAELTKREIPHRLNEDGSIGYRQVDGEAIDAVYYWVVGLYAARN